MLRTPATATVSLDATSSGSSKWQQRRLISATLPLTPLHVLRIDFTRPAFSAFL